MVQLKDFISGIYIASHQRLSQINGTKMDGFWDWYCGREIDSTENTTDGILYDNSTLLSDSTCITNAIVTLPHIAFIIISSLVLLVCSCSTYRNVSCTFLIKFPTHAFRWLFLFVFIFINIWSIGESIITDFTFHDISSTQPQLYIPAICVFLGVIMSLVYYHHCECWQAVRMLNILVLYWILCILAEMLKLRDFHVTNSGGLNVMRYVFTLINLSSYTVLALLEIYLQLSSCSKIRPTEVDELPSMKFYEGYVNMLSYILFYWIQWLLTLGYKRPLEISDMGTLPNEHLTKHNYQKLRKVFKKEMQKADSTGKEISLWGVYFKTFPVQFIQTFLLRLIADWLLYLTPIVIYAITTHFMELEQGKVITDNEPHYVTVSEFVHNPYFLCLIFVATPFTNSHIQQAFFYESAVVATHLRAAMQALIYEKSLRLYNLSGGELTMGEITNHMSTDTMNLHNFVCRGHLLWSIPLEIVVVLAILYIYMGISSILGFLTVLLLIPIQAIIIKKTTHHQEQTLKHSDVRLKRSNEMLQGMKLLKLYGWEKEFRDRIESARNQELKSLFSLNIQFGNIVTLCFMLSALIALVAFGSYPFLSGQNLTPNLAFTAFVLINLLTEPLYSLPTILSNWVNAVVATRRLSKFFSQAEIEKKDSAIQSDDKSLPSVTFQNGYSSYRYRNFNWKRRWKGFSSGSEAEEGTPLTMSPFEHQYGSYSNGTAGRSSRHNRSAIRISQGTFTWELESTAPIIRNINIDIQAGQLIMVVGAVGCGKSSLLSAIIGEMNTLSGTVEVNNAELGMAFTAQTAWIVNASLKDNILFGKSFNKTRYKQVLDACALQPDIDILPAGDLTEIGEKGINLSGGQKQRVNVARALYSDKDIVLMDDPLSALDVHVGGHLFKEGIMGFLVKNKKTVVLVTHQLQYLQHANKVLVMQQGSIIHDSTFDDISVSDPALFANWQKSIIEQSESEISGSELESDVMDEREKLKKEVRHRVLVGGDSGKASTSVTNTDPSSMSGDLIEEEELKRGSVSFDVYKYLMKSMGWPVILAILAFRLLSEVTNLGRLFWLAMWADAGEFTNGTSSADEIDNLFYFGIYGLVSLGTIIFTGLLAVCFVIGMYLAAKNIHYDMIRNIFGSYLRFFETTPTGRVLNRLSSDTQIIDVQLLVTLLSFIYFLVALPASVIAIGIVQPIFLLQILPVIICYVFVQKYFIASSRELQRLNSVTKSPIFAHFSETLGGLPTIRAYKAQERLFNELLKRIDLNNTIYLYLAASCFGWIGSTLTFLTAATLIMASVTAVTFGEQQKLNSSYIGLILSLGFTIPFLLWAIVRYATDAEIQINAVERIQHYTELPNETTEGQEPAVTWPHRGEIKMEDLYVRYAIDTPTVLKAVNLYIKPGEKVGICGRTGSGKSSLTLTLFRVIDTFRGRIIIDGEDIAQLPLRTLRRRLSIIPQEPILFTGSIRDNIDPEGVKSDAELWDAIEKAQLKSVVSEFEAGLDYEVQEGGENFSVGQRQLFCLVRAFLRDSRILIMDEATASIDYDTELILQEAVRSNFQDKTVITIAHRVSTIMKSDTIVVLNEGEIVEHDTPGNLLADQSSIFSSLVQANK